MINKFSSVDFLQIAEFGFEVVLFQIRVGERHADAAFREACGMYVDIPQQVAHRREHITIPFQFDDDQLVCPMIVIRLKIVETDVEVNRQTFCLTLVHQCHTFELVPHHRIQPVERSSPVFRCTSSCTPSVPRKSS